MDKIRSKDVDTELEQLRSSEHLRMQAEARIETEWWPDSIKDIGAALESRTLVRVPDEMVLGNCGFRLIGSLRNGDELPFLRPEAYSLLQVIVLDWRSNVVEMGLNPEGVFLSVTSLLRTDEEQRILFEKGGNAAKKSSHPAGTTIDIDPSGYYLGEDRKSIQASNPDFNIGYTLALKTTLQKFQDAGLCHVIFEKGYEKIDENEIGTRESCYHVCVSPDFQGL